MKVITSVKKTDAEKDLFSELSSIGYEVKPVQSKEKVFQLLEASTEPCLIFLDADLDVDLCAEIKQSEHYGEHYVIMLIDETNPEQIVASMKAEADDCLGKTLFEAEDIYAHVKLAELALKNRIKNALHRLSARDVERRYRVFIQESDEPIWFVELKQPCNVSLSEEEQMARFSQHGYLIECNDALAQSCSFTKATELVGKRLRELLLFDCPINVQTLRAFISSGYKLANVETKRVDAEGNERFYLNSLTGVVENDSLSCIWGTRREITWQKRTEVQLRQAQKMEALGRLVGGVAHDFNNLLTAIAGYGDLVLQKATGKSPFYEDLREMRKATERACMLTRQLLMFSRKQPSSIEVVNLNVLAADFSKLIRRLIGEDIRIKLLLDIEPSCVKADPSQLEQILLNFAVNARDAMPTGGELQIAVRNVDFDEDFISAKGIVLAGRYVMLSVRDTGCGMSDNTMSQIFEPFFTTKDECKGTGLGLATVCELIERQSGFITVDSKLDAGTTFNVYLPREIHDVVKEPEPVEKANVKQGREIVLLVEDEEAVRHAVSEILEMNGYKVLKASNGIEALEVSQAHNSEIDLLLTDVVMPQMNGRQLADKFLTQHPEANVMFMSGYTDDAIVKHGVMGEEVAFIQKPFALAAFIKKVREVLDNKNRPTKEFMFKINSTVLPAIS